jgi:hypothetical protein
MEIALENLSFNLHFNPALFFSAGQALNDKDRDNNHDSREIQNFFKPIDNLFGDYEVMKKFDHHQNLYLNDANTQRVFILKLSANFSHYSSLSKEEFPIEKVYEEKDSLFVFYLYLNSINYKYELEVEPKKQAELGSVIIKEIKEAKKINDLNLLQIFILDPEKLIQCVNYDLTRFKHHVKLFSINENIDQEILFAFFQQIYKKRKESNSQKQKVDFYEFDTIPEFLTDWGLDNNDENKKIVKNFISRKYKFKNYERHEYFKARLGKENGQFVLFLHPYESESNNPVRFPPGGQ